MDGDDVQHVKSRLHQKGIIPNSTPQGMWLMISIHSSWFFYEIEMLKWCK
jgi:hypothetical protein